MITSDSSTKVPLLDVVAQTQSLRPEIEAAIGAVLDRGDFILGRAVAELEARIAAYCECAGAVGVASGTDALLLALKAAGVGPGDEVITTPYTFFATAGAIHNVGARPVFLDVYPDSFNINLEGASEKITPRTKAIIPVHLFGQCADMEGVVGLAESTGLTVIEDAAQAIGARQLFRGEIRSAGTMGACGCFSFFPSKNLGGLGDGGIITSQDTAFLDKVRILRVHGSAPKYYHHVVGFNSRLDTLQAAVLLVKLNRLDEWTRKRRENADLYRRLFEEAGLNSVIELPVERRNRFHVYNQFVVKCQERDRLQIFLGERNVSTAIYYPVPLHLQRCFEHLGYREGDFPVSEELAKTSLALPIYPEIKPEQIEHVVRSIGLFYQTL
jgi:dTDP-4-amino-4,6-dideoxygalactose transaminase